MDADVKVRQYYPKGSYVIRICSHASGDFQGNVYFPQSSHSVSFSTAWGLVKLIDEDIAKNSYPQNTFEIRRWARKAGAPRKHKPEKTKNVQPKKAACSFLIHVQYYRNATWQGSIHWMEGKQTRMFRSEFELLMLIEEAADRTNKRTYTKELIRME